MPGINAQQVYMPAPDQSATTGAVACAPVATAAPTDASTTLPNAWNTGGYVDENGISMSIGRTFTAIKDWSLSVVRKALTEYDGVISLSFLQVDEFAMKAVFGDENVTVRQATTSKSGMLKVGVGAHVGEVKSWVFNMKDGDRRVRVYIPRGQITEVDGDVTFVPGAANVFPCKLSTYDDGTGNSIYLFYEDGQKASA